MYNIVILTSLPHLPPSQCSQQWVVRCLPNRMLLRLSAGCF